MVTVATFNVKDLIDSLLPEPLNGAANPIRSAKLDVIAAEIARANPDVLGLQEVGSEALVQAVVDRLPNPSEYRVVMGTVDARGIGCALISRLPIVKSHIHQTDELPFPVFHPEDPPPFGKRLPLRRGLVHAVVEAPAPFGQMHIVVAHFKSKASVPAKSKEGEPVFAKTGAEHADAAIRSLVWRSAEALFARHVIDECFATSPLANVVMMGDLNDDASSVPLRVLRGRGETALFGVEDRVPAEKRFSILHAGKPEQIDHLLVSPALLSHVTGADIQNEALRSHVFISDDEPPSTDSDHALYKLTLA